MNIVYFVHDLNDPAVHRRMRMLHAAGGSVCLLGFCRGAPPIAVEGIVPIVLGRTADARLRQRAAAVAMAMLRLPRLAAAMADADLVIARQLETLLLASMARVVYARQARLVFECLDIHRLMGEPGMVGRFLRGLEGWLLAGCQGLAVSSPVFVTAHLARVHARLPPVTLIENKVLSSELTAPALEAVRPAGPPWRIGWYGMIRCARSLRLLAALVTARPGEVEVVIRGRVARAAVPDFDAVVAATPGLSFGGPYDRARDLARLYGDVHFAWAIDYYEAGSNSDWLLPNRLYEAGLFGAVPIADATVAAGAWLAEHHVGALLVGEPAAALDRFFDSLNPAGYSGLAEDLARLPQSAFVTTTQDCRDLLESMLGRPHLPVAMATSPP